MTSAKREGRVRRFGDEDVEAELDAVLRAEGIDPGNPFVMALRMLNYGRVVREEESPND